MTNLSQRNFGAGEISPQLWGRVDLPKYQSGMRQMRNWMVQRFGGATVRPGTEFAGEVKNSLNKVRLIPWVLDDAYATDIYVLELGDHYVRFFQNGARITVSSAPAWLTATSYAAGAIVVDAAINYVCILSHTSGATTEPGVGAAWGSNWYALTGNILEIPTPYAAADLSRIQYVQNQNVMTLAHPLYPVQELTRISAANPQQWTTASTVFGPSIATPAGLAYQSGGAAGGPTYWAVTSVDAVTGEESLAAVTQANFVPSVGSPVILVWSLVTGVQQYNVYRSVDGVTFGFVDKVGSATLSSSSNAVWSSTLGHVVTNTQSAWVAGTSLDMPNVVAVATDKASDGKYTVTARIKTIGSLGAFFTQGRAHAYYKRTGDAAFVDAGIIATSSVTGNTSGIYLEFLGTVLVPDNGYTNLEILVTAEVNGVGGVGAQFECDIDSSLAPDNKITWSKTFTGYTDKNGLQDNTNSVPRDLKLFQAPGDYPTTIASYQQRRVFGGSANQPGYIWASRTGSRKNFAIPSPVVPGSPLIFEMDSKKAVIIRHLIDLARMAVFTATEEKIIEGRYDSGIIEPDNINVRSHSYNGIAQSLRPIVIDDTAIYVQGRGNQIRMIKYGDENTDMIGADLSLYARHLFRGHTIVDWTFAYTEDSIVWAVRDDGKLLGLTYLSEKDGGYGWHRHDTDGLVESVCCVPEGTTDRLYLSIQRTINGVTKRYIERMTVPVVKDVTDIRDAHYMDCGLLAYDGRNIDLTNPVTLSGGVAWLSTEHLTLTAVKSVFVPGDANTTMMLQSPPVMNPDGTITPGDRLYFFVDTYTSGFAVSGFPLKLVPSTLQGIAVTDWARCQAQVTNLAHLEGKKVSVLADGYVDSSPNNGNYATITVVGGTITLSSPRSVIRVGLPYIADLETLDIDSVQTTVKRTNRMISAITAMLENTRGLFFGLATSPTSDDPLNLLDELKLRETESWDDPTFLLSGDADVPISSTHNRNGRFLTRQVDPLPATVLMLSPSFDES